MDNGNNLRPHGAFLASLLLIALSPVQAHANECQALLDQLQQAGDATDLTGVTLNVNGVASFISTNLRYSKGWGTSAGSRPDAYATVHEAFDAGQHAQTFSDRIRDGLPTPPQQRFDANRADDVDVFITDAETPEVTLTLRTWGNARTSFVPTCRDNFLTGHDAAGVEYVLRLTPTPPVL